MGLATAASVACTGLRKGALLAVALASVVTSGNGPIQVASAAEPTPIMRYAAKSTTIEMRRQSGGAIGATEMTWWHYQVLLNNPDLELLLRYVNTDKGWKIGPELPKDFKYTASRKNLDRMLRPSATSGLGVNSTVGISENGKAVGSHNTSRYVFALAATRNSGKPYTATVECGRDLKSGYYWTRVAVREFKDGNVLNIHEYAVSGGKVFRTSNKKGETFLLRALHMAGGQAPEAFAKRTLPAMQQASSLFAQTKVFLASDPNASINELASATITVDVASDQSWWDKIKDQILQKIKELGEKLVKKLFETLQAYIKDHYQEILKFVGSYFQGILDSVLGSLGDFFEWLKGIF